MMLIAAPTPTSKSLKGDMLTSLVTGGIGSFYLTWNACNNILWPGRAIYIEVKETIQKLNLIM